MQIHVTTWPVGGEGLEPISAEEARRWLEEKDFTDELEEYFSDQIEEA
jgi:hypothetical protein